MQIYLARNNQQAGPYSLEQLNQMLSSQQVLLTDLVWHQGMTEWKALGELTQGQLKYEPVGQQIVNPTFNNTPFENNLDQNITTQKTPITPNNVQAAPVGKRISAKVTDLALFFLPQLMVMMYYMPDEAKKIAESGASMENQMKVVEILNESIPVSAHMAMLAFVFILLLVQSTMIKKSGQSIGKKLFNLQIVDNTTLLPPGSLRGFFVRSFLFIVLSQMVAFMPLLAIIFIIDLVMFFSKGNIALHDRIAKTRVIEISK
ncbi:RDD family protein [Acinetobacter sp. TY1]|uniref:RDD family protein n=1 Tax=Acinetobacter sp. TY1 TaxID=3387626 RepID=UPI003AF77819